MRAACTKLAVTGAAVIWAATVAQAAGDPALGKQLYEQRCSGCHSVDTNRIGPLHQGVFGRKAGSVPQFNYSDALRHSKIVWDEKTLTQWLANPEALIPGQKMGYQVANAQDRDQLVAYLKTLKP